MTAARQVLLSEALPMVEAEESELENVVHSYSRFVYQVAFSVLRNHHDAEDATQETFIRVLRNWKRFARVESRRAWLARTAWRVALDRRKPAREISLEEAAGAILGLRATGAGPEQIAATQQMEALLERLISTLPRDLRDALILSTVEEMTSARIGEVLGIPEGSVRTRLMRAREVLREKLSTLLEGKHAR